MANRKGNAPKRRNVVHLHAKMRTGAGLHGNGRRPEGDWVPDWEYEVEMAAEAEAQFERQAAFGEGVELVNILTGQRHRT